MKEEALHGGSTGVCKKAEVEMHKVLMTESSVEITNEQT